MKIILAAEAGCSPFMYKTIAKKRKEVNLGKQCLCLVLFLILFLSRGWLPPWEFGCYLRPGSLEDDALMASSPGR